MDALGAGVKSVKARLKEIEAWRKGYTDPLLELVETYRAQARPAEQAYAALEQAIKGRVLRYRNECAAAEATAKAAAYAAQLQAQQAAQAGRAQEAQALQRTAFTAMQAAAPVMSTAGVATVKTWALRIIDKAAVPERFKVVDETAILAEVREKLGKASEARPEHAGPLISGVEIYVKESIRA